MIISRALVSMCSCALLVMTAAAQDAPVLRAYSLGTESLTQWRLPEKLNEISGLAFNADGRLFAVADEAAIVYELDIEAGRIVKAFAFGEPVIRGDFEGIAALGREIYLLTSAGDIVSGAEGADGERMPFTRTETGLGRECELEGLAQQRPRNRLLIACKQLRRGRSIDGLMVFAWSAERRELIPSAAVAVPVGNILRRLRSDRLNPSGIAVEQASGHILLVASRQRALIELAQDGRLLHTSRLAATRHRQPEGIELGRDGRLLIADEGGSHKARLGIYARDRAGDTAQ